MEEYTWKHIIIPIISFLFLIFAGLYSSAKSIKFKLHYTNDNLKIAIDKYLYRFCNYKPDNRHIYENDVEELVYKAIFFTTALSDAVEEAYSSAQKNDCYISSYKDFLKMKKIMLENPENYKDKDVCIEGYIFFRWSDAKYATIFPLPCTTNFERRMAERVNKKFTEEIYLHLPRYTDLDCETGTHVRIYGKPYFFIDSNGQIDVVGISIDNYEKI